MQIVKRRMKSKDNSISLDIPEYFLNKELEVTIKISRESIEKELLLDVVQIDTKSWKFDREEIYNE